MRLFIATNEKKSSQQRSHREDRGDRDAGLGTDGGGVVVEERGGGKALGHLVAISVVGIGAADITPDDVSQKHGKYSQLGWTAANAVWDAAISAQAALSASI